MSLKVYLAEPVTVVDEQGLTEEIESSVYSVKEIDDYASSTNECIANLNDSTREIIRRVQDLEYKAWLQSFIISILLGVTVAMATAIALLIIFK